MIIRSGGGQYTSGGYILRTQMITRNQNWIVPKAKDQKFSVRVFGGGGSSAKVNMYTNSTAHYHIGGGGGGNMNNNTLVLNHGDIIPISIGEGGDNGYSGGTTSFGTYLYATGGQAGNGIRGGNGGTGGGACYPGGIYHGDGGNATYGGGGGSCYMYENSHDRGFEGYGGTGGTYGGAGGGYRSAQSNGGYGNGGGYGIDAEDGLNTINLATELEFVGDGKAGSQNSNKQSCGGGGYGGRGGKGFAYKQSGYNKPYGIGGGGGGYGGNGGNCSTNLGIVACGGGGGYGNDGDDGYAVCTTGGGYEGLNLALGGGGGGYGPEGFGHGGTSTGPLPASGRAGVCIITYMEPVQ